MSQKFITVILVVAIAAVNGVGLVLQKNVPMADNPSALPSIQPTPLLDDIFQTPEETTRDIPVPLPSASPEAAQPTVIPSLAPTSSPIPPSSTPTATSQVGTDEATLISGTAYYNDEPLALMQVTIEQTDTTTNSQGEFALLVDIVAGTKTTIYIQDDAGTTYQAQITVNPKGNQVDLGRVNFQLGAN